MNERSRSSAFLARFWSQHYLSASGKTALLPGRNLLVATDVPSHPPFAFLHHTPFLMPQDDEPPPLKLSLDEFVELLRGLLAHEQTAEFIHLVLAGMFHGRKVFIDSLASRIYDVDDDDKDEDDLYPYEESRDFDSVLGISDNICVYGKNITFALLPKHSESLSKDIGISRRIEYRGVSSTANEMGVDSHNALEWSLRRSQQDPKRWLRTVVREERDTNLLSGSLATEAQRAPSRRARRVQALLRNCSRCVQRPPSPEPRWQSPSDHGCRAF